MSEIVILMRWPLTASACRRLAVTGARDKHNTGLLEDLDLPWPAVSPPTTHEAVGKLLPLAHLHESLALAMLSSGGGVNRCSVLQELSTNGFSQQVRQATLQRHGTIPPRVLKSPGPGLAGRGMPSTGCLH